MNQNQKTDKKSKSISAIIGFAVFVLVSFGVKQFFKKDVATELKKAAQKVNAQSPMMVDEYTQLDSAAAVGETKLIYYYTLKAIEKSQIERDTVEKYMKEGIIEDLRVSPEVKAFRDNNITLGYNYYDKNGELIVNIEATPEDYR